MSGKLQSLISMWEVGKKQEETKSVPMKKKVVVDPKKKKEVQAIYTNVVKEKQKENISHAPIVNKKEPAPAVKKATTPLQPKSVNVVNRNNSEKRKSFEALNNNGAVAKNLVNFWVTQAENAKASEALHQVVKPASPANQKPKQQFQPAKVSAPTPIVHVAPKTAPPAPVVAAPKSAPVVQAPPAMPMPIPVPKAAPAPTMAMPMPLPRRQREDSDDEEESNHDDSFEDDNQQQSQEEEQAPAEQEQQQEQAPAEQEQQQEQQVEEQEYQNNQEQEQVEQPQQQEEEEEEPQSQAEQEFEEDNANPTAGYPQCMFQDQISQN